MCECERIERLLRSGSAVSDGRPSFVVGMRRRVGHAARTRVNEEKTRRASDDDDDDDTIVM